MSISDAIAQFLAWLNEKIQGKTTPPPPKFGEVCDNNWRLGQFMTVGELPNNIYPKRLYKLEVSQVRVKRGLTPAEIRWGNENALSMVPSHRFCLSYQTLIIRDGVAALGDPITVFSIEKNCQVSPTASANWIACNSIGLKLRDRILEICNSPATEKAYKLTGKVLKEGESLKDFPPSKTGMVEVERVNIDKLDLTPYPSRVNNNSAKKWEVFIEGELLKLRAKK